MKIEVKVPSPGESINQVQLATWLVDDKSFVEKDQEIAEIDSDKATLSISAEEDGKIEFLIEEGETVDVGAVICTIDTSSEGKPTKPQRRLRKLPLIQFLNLLRNLIKKKNHKHKPKLKIAF